MLDILRAQSADELEEAVSEWTEVRPATAGFALTGKSRALSRFQSHATFFEDLRMVWAKFDLRFEDDLRKLSKPLFRRPRWLSNAESVAAGSP